jgi:hypothetical protein
MTPRQRASDRHPLLTFISDWANRIIPPLLVTAVVAISGGAWATYKAVEKITGKVTDHDRELHELKIKYENDVALLRAQIAAVQVNSVRRAELLEILKRVEQQLEIALLRSGVKVPPKALSGGSAQ